MENVNKSYGKGRGELTGNIVNSELKLGTSKAGKAYAMFTLAVNGSGERDANFHTILVWGEGRINYLQSIFKKGLYMHISDSSIETSIVRDEDNEFVRKEYYFYANSFHAIYVAPRVDKPEEANISQEALALEQEEVTA